VTAGQTRQPRIRVDQERIAAFCRKWRIAGLALFGSVLRDDCPPDSDVDVAVRLQPAHGLSLFDWADMIDELELRFGRQVDLVDRGGLRDPFRRHSILTNKQAIYAAWRCGRRVSVRNSHPKSARARQSVGETSAASPRHGA
jgi:predicted nucleotidyltransferase